MIGEFIQVAEKAIEKFTPGLRRVFLYITITMQTDSVPAPYWLLLFSERGMA